MKTIILYILSIIGWITLANRLYLKITTSGFSFLESTVQFFSYFTILTNLLVTVYCTIYLLSKNRKIRTTFISGPEMLTALTVYMLIVGTVYHIALRSLWHPEGLGMIINEIHHTLVPLGTLTLWILSTNNKLSNLKILFNWLLYPILYISFVLIRGSFSGFYPYPFINVAELGIGKVMINSLYLLIVTSILFFAFYFIEKRRRRKSVANRN